ncbi:MAG: TonB family protein [Terracidiphilus sp.]|jgi:TonB family protein
MMRKFESPGRATFGLLPEPERSPGSFIASFVINGLMVALMFYIGATAKRAIENHKYEMTELIVPRPAPPLEKVKLPEPPKVELPKPPDVKLELPKINVPRPEPKPDLKPIQIEAKVALPVIKEAKPSVILAPQPKAALTAAMPAQDNRVKPSTAPVHLGETFGVTPNPNAKGPATIAAIGNPYGGMKGPAIAPHGVVGSTGIGNGLKFGSNAGVVGKVASAGIPASAAAPAATYTGSKVAAAPIPVAPVAAPAQKLVPAPVTATDLEIVSKPTPDYTSEARQLKVQGDVVLRVTFTSSGRVVVQGIVHGLGHGLDEEARRVAERIHFRPATRNGQPVDLTTTVTITFQLA